jgi:hypothetical protein
MTSTLPEPRAALVIRYAYLWRDEYERGQEEGVKDRPCAVILVTKIANEETQVTVLPITHTPPREKAHGVRLPEGTCRRLGLDNEAKWIVLTEANRFVWPGPDLRVGARGDPRRVDYGFLPARFFAHVRDSFIALARKQRPPITERSD